MTRSRRTGLIASHLGWTAGPVVFTVFTVALLATACGGSGSGPGGSANAVAHLGTTSTVVHPGTTSPTSGAGAAAGGEPDNEATTAELVKLAYCMRSHGVLDFPMPKNSSNRSRQNISVQVPPQFRGALASCKKYVPAGGAASEHISTAEQGYYVKAAQCMRAHGINGFPDPTFSNGNVQFPVPQGMNTNAPQFEAARHTCEKLIPNGLPNGATDEIP